MKTIELERRSFLIGAAATAIATSGLAGRALAQKKPMKVALVLTGRVNDPGFSNAGYVALQAMKEKYGAEIAYQESLVAADAEQVFRAYGEDGFSYIIVMGGGNYDDQIRNVSPDYPEMKFIVVSGEFTELPNIVAIRTGNAGVAYMAGVLMAEMTKTGTIGLVGGVASPPSMQDHVAIIAGARFAKPDIKTLDVYTESYVNPQLGKEAAIAQIEQGADIIFANGNTTSFGVFQAAQQKQVLVIGAATDQNAAASDVILTSVVYGTDRGVQYLVDLDQSGKGWENKIYTMDLNLVGLAPFHGLEAKVPESARKKLEEVRLALMSGSITVPKSYEELGLAGPSKK